MDAGLTTGMKTGVETTMTTILFPQKCAALAMEEAMAMS